MKITKPEEYTWKRFATLKVKIKCPKCKKERIVGARRTAKTDMCQPCGYSECTEKRLRNMKLKIAKPRYLRYCKHCGKSMMITANQIKDGRVVCNNRCRIELTKKRKKCICLICKKEFIRPLSALGHYCSRKCQGVTLSKYWKDHPEEQKRRAHKRTGRIASEEQRNKHKIATLKNWGKDKYLYNIFRGVFFKGLQLTKLDKKVIEASILLHKIRRSLNVTE